MAFYRKQANYHAIEDVCGNIIYFFRNNLPVVKPEESGIEDDVKEAFLVTRKELRIIEDKYSNLWNLMHYSDTIDAMPLDDSYENFIIYIREDKNIKKQTMTRSHIRLPKLGYLITLTPQDFFNVFKILMNSTTTAYGTSVVLNDPTLLTPAITQYFITNDAAIRTNPEYTDRKWTCKEDIALIANLPATPLNQLYAIQYLNARNNLDLLYFPVDTAVQLELDWDQLTESYVAPQPEIPFKEGI